MVSKKFNLPGIRPDNEYSYFDVIEGLTSHVDNNASITLDSPPSGGIIVTIVPSESYCREKIISNVLSLHKLFGIKTDFSKSTQIQKSIIFQVHI